MIKDIEIEGLPELMDDIARAGRDSTQLVTAALANSTEYGKQQIRSRAPHAFGTLQRSILGEVKYPVGEIVVQEPYGRDVEEGTKPHTPPHEAIERWAKKKGLPKGVSWAIVKTIEKRGTRAQPFFNPGWEASEKYILNQFEKVVDRLMSILGKGR
jgi:hypothetical protein